MELAPIQQCNSPAKVVLSVFIISKMQKEAGKYSAIKRTGDGVLIQGDLKNETEVKSVIDLFLQKAGGIDILVNNAGGLPKRNTLAEVTSQYIDELYQTNLKSVFLVTKYSLAYLKQSRGAIINIGSIAGHSGGEPGSGVYAAMKGAICTATIAMAKEFASFGIRVNSVLPGFIDTFFHENITSQELREQFVKSIPLKRTGTATEIANVILFLASEASSYITGEYVAVNGGLAMRN